MYDAPLPDVDPAEAMLSELAGLDMTLARHVHACAVACEDHTEVIRLSDAYHRVARSARQSLALLAKLKRERLAEKATAGPRKTDWVRVRTRQNELRRAVCRVIWDEVEHESEDEELYLDILHNALNNQSREPDFGLTPLHDHVLDLCAAMNLPLEKAAQWAELPDLSATRNSRPPLRWLADGDETDDEGDDAFAPQLPHGQPQPQSSA